MGRSIGTHLHRWSRHPIGAIVTGMALAVVPLGAAAPAAAAPPSLVVAADQPAAVPAGHVWGFDDFFPRKVTVPQGATVGFEMEGFHTATLLPQGTTSAQDSVTSGIVSADTDDTTPNPNGTTHAIANIPALMPIPASGCGTDASPCTFDGSGVVSSGVSFAPPPAGTMPAPFVVTITGVPGTYIFHCRIHPKMDGTLTVVASSEQGTTPDELASAASAQVQEDVAAGTAAETAASTAASQKNADGTTSWTLAAGTSSPDGHTVVLEMLPADVAIKPGDSVTWKALGSDEVHTVTFPGDLDTDLLPLCEDGSVDTPGVPAHSPPQSPFDFGCGSGPLDEVEFGGGNGVAAVTSPKTVSDSGTIATEGIAAQWGVPDTTMLPGWTVSFAGASAGTYGYVCQIHDGMKGTITVAAS